MSQKKIDEFICVNSSDQKFLVRLIDWLNSQTCEPNSTIVRVQSIDPFKEADYLRAQIEGMKIRMHDAENKIRQLTSNT